MDEFAKCFQDADNVVITPIYSAGEQEISGINTSTIAHQIKLNSFNNASNSTHISENLNDAVIKAHNIIKSIDLNKGAVVLTLGAGDVRQAGNMLLEKLKLECK